MPVQPIRDPSGRIKGWQARAYVPKSKSRSYLSRYFANDKHGGSRTARALAKDAEPNLQRAAGARGA